MTRQLVFARQAIKDARKLSASGLKRKAEELLAILQDDPCSHQGGPQTVRFGKVPRLLGGSARFDHALDVGCIEPVTGRDARLQERGGVPFKQAQHPAKGAQLRSLSRRMFATVLVGQLKQHSQRLGCVEVIVHCGLEPTRMLGVRDKANAGFTADDPLSGTRATARRRRGLRAHLLQAGRRRAGADRARRGALHG